MSSMRLTKTWVYSLLAIAGLTTAVVFNLASCSFVGIALTIVGAVAGGYIAGVITALNYPPPMFAILNRILTRLDQLQSLLMEEQQHQPLGQSLPNDLDLSSFKPIAAFNPCDQPHGFIVVVRSGDEPNKFVQSLNDDGGVQLTEQPEAATSYRWLAAGMSTAWYTYLILAGQKRVEVLPAPKVTANREN